MSQLNTRLITGDLQPNNLGVQQTVADTYARPQQVSAGADFVQLGRALESLNPGLGAIMGKLAQDEEARQRQSEEAQGMHDRASIKDAMEAQSNLDQNRANWSPERIAGYEMTD